MKKKICYSVTLLCLMSLGSCKKFLETTPTDFLNPDAYYETEDQLQFARAGVYHHLGTAQLYARSAIDQYAWQADEGYMNRASLTTGPFNYFYSSGDSYTAGLWTNLYNGINRANVVIANVDKSASTVSQEKRDQVRGEMLFLRGYYYFILVQYFGGVPLKITPTTSVIDVDIARSSVQEVYDQILSDMIAAESLVPGITELGFGGAVSKSAVRGMLARVCLTMAGEPLKDASKYQEARDWAKKVMDDTEAGHELNPSFMDVFRRLAADEYDIKESIWEVEFFGNRTDQWVETVYQGWLNGPPSANPNTGRADAYLCITSKYYNVFEPGDNRKWFSIAHYTNVASGANGTKTMRVLPPNEATKNLMHPAKFRREYETLLPKFATHTPQNVPLLRFSDVLLMFAEAENEVNNGPTPAAIEAVNRVRQRGWSSGVSAIQVTNGGSGYTSAPTVTITAGNGMNAAATATIANGQVTAITLNRDPAAVMFYAEGKYDTPPTVTITGGGGSGATATATIHRIIEANATTEQTSSKANFLAFLQDERMRELGFENQRKADLLRWGIFLEVHQDMGNRLQVESPGQFFVRYYSNVTAKDLLMPIPAIDISLNQLLVQNPGWN